MNCKYGFYHAFRPFGNLQNAWLIKRYTFNTEKEQLDFFKALPNYKKKYPFDYGLYIIPKED